MRIVSHRKLVEFYSSEGHADAQAALERWYDIAERAQWKSLSDMKVDFLQPIMWVINTMCLTSEETNIG